MRQQDQQKVEASFILDCFENFYREVLNMKKKVYAAAWTQPDLQGNTVSADAYANVVLKHLQRILDEQMMEASYGGAEFAENYYSEAQYVMAVLADEVFLSIDWPGRAHWERNLLEDSMFGTHSAGQDFYDKLDILLNKADPVRRDVGLVYLYAIGVGFRGKYRGEDAHGVLEKYKKDLFFYINRTKPQLLIGENRLFPDAYEHTIEGAKYQNLPNAQNWHLIFAAIGLTYLFFSYVIWYSNTWEISHLTREILEFSEAADDGGAQ